MISKLYVYNMSPLYDCETGGNNENWLVEIKQKPVMHDVNEQCCHKTSTAKSS